MHLSGKLGGAPAVHGHRARQPVVSPSVPCVPSTSGRCVPLQAAVDQQGCMHHYQVPKRLKRPSLRAAAKAASATEAAEEKGDEEAAPASTRTPRDQKLTGPEILERGAPEHPYPGEFQQTLITSFTLGGTGLHTGDYAYVRVRPAFAGEGRYVVRVPEGTNADLMETSEPVAVELEEGGQMDIDPELEEKKVELFKRYLVAQEDEAFTGTFKQYMHELDATDLLSKWQAGGDPQKDEWEFDEPEEIQPRGEDEGVLCSIEEVYIPAAVSVALGDMEGPEKSVVGVELLLAALEATGVDNARIEIEGGFEIPQLDGSALGWAMEIQFAGLREAPRKDGQPGLVRREAVRYQGEPFTVTGGGGWISFVPEDNMRITAGVDHHLVAQSVGKQWRTWSIFEDLPFRFDIGGARRWLPSPEHLQILSTHGFYKGFSEGTVNIASGDSWIDPTQIRFVHDEAARHEIVVTLGMMALNAKPGHAGLPFGHITTYKASPALRLEFVSELRQRIQDADWEPVWDVPLNIHPDAQQLNEYLEFNEQLTMEVFQREQSAANPLDEDDVVNDVMYEDEEDEDEGAEGKEGEEGEEGEEPPVVDA